MIDLSSDQQKALDTLIDWYTSENQTQYISLGGYAGTGKTTLMSVFRSELNKISKKKKVAFCSYTGKASRVLRNSLEKGNTLLDKDSVSTIHSLIYSPVENDRGVITGWEKHENVVADLIIVDEASMVNKEVWEDLLSYGIPIIAVGDHGQLPPVKSSFNLMKTPDIKLEEIHRQTKDNPIIKVATLARMFGQIPAKEYSKKVIKYSKDDPWTKDALMEMLSNYNKDTLILSGFNHTRVRLNKHLRSVLEFYEQAPLNGDRVICLRNNREQKIFNGMLGTIYKIEDHNENWYKAEIQMDDDLLYSGLIAKDQFNNPEPFNFTEDRAKYMDGDLFDFGYALTVHKAQGSEAEKVLLFEEKSQHMDANMWRRWLYTAVTRAKSELYIF